MKVILTTQKEKTNVKQITDLLNLMLFDYNIEIVDKKEEKKKTVKRNKKSIIKDKIETNKTVLERPKRVIKSDPEKRKREREWLEDYYYSQNKDREEIDRLVNYYSDTKELSNYY